MDYNESMASLEAEGFVWGRFPEYFPFGDIRLGEGNYQRLVERALSLLDNPEQQAVLLSLLDAQTCVRLEQIWVQGEQDPADALPVHGHILSAWLQINSNIRFALGLPDRDLRGAMLGLPRGEMLADRIIQPVGPAGRLNKLV